MNTYEIKWRWHCWDDITTTLVTAQDEQTAKNMIICGDSGSYKRIIGVKLCVSV